MTIDYTNCDTMAPFTNERDSVIFGSENEMPSNSYYSSFKSGVLNAGQHPKWRTFNKTVRYKSGRYSTDTSGGHEVENTKVCQIEFTIPNDIGPSVYLYYRLTDFFQNHRRYVKSYDSNQLIGDSPNPPAASCSPLDISSFPAATSTAAGPASTAPLVYYPCGLVANSLFNDTILSPSAVSTGSNNSNYTMSNRGIAWSSDTNLYGKNAYSLNAIKPPPYWQVRWADGVYSTDNPPPNLASYEEFQVWMRTAGLPAFSKLALRNDTAVMKQGTYRIEIHNSKKIHLHFKEIGY